MIGDLAYERVQARTYHKATLCLLVLCSLQLHFVQEVHHLRRVTTAVAGKTLHPLCSTPNVPWYVPAYVTPSNTHPRTRQWVSTVAATVAAQTKDGARQQKTMVRSNMQQQQQQPATQPHSPTLEDDTARSQTNCRDRVSE